MKRRSWTSRRRRGMKRSRRRSSGTSRGQRGRGDAAIDLDSTMIPRYRLTAGQGAALFCRGGRLRQGSGRAPGWIRDGSGMGPGWVRDGPVISCEDVSGETAGSVIDQ